MYSRPRLSRNTAPWPSTRTSGSWSGAHQSCIDVNGCHRYLLSAATRSSVFQSFMRGVLAKQFFDRIDVFRRRSAPLILPKDDVFQRLKIVQERTLIICPLRFVGVFRLEPPHASELGYTDFALSSFRVPLRPYVLTPH